MKGQDTLFHFIRHQRQEIPVYLNSLNLFETVTSKELKVCTIWRERNCNWGLEQDRCVVADCHSCKAELLF